MNYCYISVLTTNEYLAGALVVNKCLELIESKYPYYIIITENIKDTVKQKLINAGINLIYEQSHFLENYKKGQEHKWYYTFSKLNIFKQTNFDKCIFLDLDLVICENIDYLFNTPVFSAVNAGGFMRPRWKALNSGFMIFKPSIDIYNKCIDLLNSGEDFANDQDIIGKVFKVNEYNNLGAEYNMFVDDLHQAKKRIGLDYVNSIDRINKDKKENTVKILHYISVKPWIRIKKTKAYKLWSDIYDLV